MERHIFESTLSANSQYADTIINYMALMVGDEILNIVIPAITMLNRAEKNLIWMLLANNRVRPCRHAKEGKEQFDTLIRLGFVRCELKSKDGDEWFELYLTEAGHKAVIALDLENIRVARR